MIIKGAGLNYIISEGDSPFSVSKIDDNSVIVKTGKVHFKGAWATPTWLNSDTFNENKSIDETTTLSLRIDIAVGAGTVSEDGVFIGWDVTPSQSTLPSIEYDIDFLGETIAENPVDGQIIIDIATVTFENGSITNIEQLVDSNIILPWNDITITLTSGGTS